jgi:hypothetical protein
VTTVYEIEHLIAASSQFTEGAPALGGTALKASDAEGKRTFVDASDAQVEGDAGGLFEFPFAASTVLWKIERVFLVVGAGATYTLKVVSGSDEVTIASASGSAAYILDDVATLGRGDKLSLLTAGATLAMKARVIARPILTIPA